MERKVNCFTCSIAVRAFFNISGKLPCASKKGYCKTKDEKRVNRDLSSRVKRPALHEPNSI